MYEKQTWVDGVSIANAERMNHMEEGIAQSSKIENITNYTMLNNCTLSTNEPMQLKKTCNLVNLKCIVQAETTFTKSQYIEIMQLPSNVNPTGSFYKMVGVGTSGFAGWSVQNIGSLCITNDGKVKVNIGANDNCKYVFIDACWILGGN